MHNDPSHIECGSFYSDIDSGIYDYCIFLRERLMNLMNEIV